MKSKEWGTMKEKRDWCGLHITRTCLFEKKKMELGKPNGNINHRLIRAREVLHLKLDRIKLNRKPITNGIHINNPI